MLENKPQQHLISYLSESTDHLFWKIFRSHADNLTRLPTIMYYFSEVSIVIILVTYLFFLNYCIWLAIQGITEFQPTKLPLGDFKRKKLLAHFGEDNNNKQ